MCHKEQFCVVLSQQLHACTQHWWAFPRWLLLIWLLSWVSDAPPVTLLRDLLPLWIHTFQFSHHCGKNRLRVRHVYLVILPLLLPYQLVLSNLSSELSASAFFLVSFYTGRSSIAAVRLRLKKKINQRKQMGFPWMFLWINIIFLVFQWK